MNQLQFGIFDMRKIRVDLHKLMQKWHTSSDDVLLIDTRSYSNYIKYVLVILYSISTYLQTAIPLFSNTRA